MIPTLLIIIAVALKLDGSISAPWTVLVVLWAIGVLCEFIWVMND